MDGEIGSDPGGPDMCLLAKCKFISNGGAADVMQESARCDRRLSECLGGCGRRRKWCRVRLWECHPGQCQPYSGVVADAPTAQEEK